MKQTDVTVSAVIFDLDGTLLDTLADIAAAFNAALEKRGLPPHPVDAYRLFVGDGPRVLARRALPEEERTEQNIEGCLMDYIEFYRSNPQPAARPYPGIPGMLDELAGRGVAMAVVSNKEQAAAENCVKDLLGAWRFSPVFGFREGAPRKPDPHMALKAAGRLGLPPAQIAFVGDTAIDMKTATAADMLPVGVLWGFRGERELRDNGAAILLEAPGQLFDHLRK